MSANDNPKKLSSISAVFPCFNDGGTIPSMVLTALIALREITDDYEVIVTNDGSNDYAGIVLNELSQRYPELHIVEHDQNMGYGASLRSGFEASKKEWIFYTDGDAQYNPLELKELAAALTDKVDIVNGYKISRSDPWIRKVIGRIYHHFVSLTFGIHLRDVDCDFRLIRRKAIENIKLESISGAICVEMIKKLQDYGYIFAEVPVNHYHRQYGRSQFFNFTRIARVIKQLTYWHWKLVIKKEHMKK